MPDKISLEQKYYDVTTELFYQEKVRVKSHVQQEHEAILSALTQIYDEAIEKRNPVELLIIERHSIHAEYSHLESNTEINDTLKTSRLKTLDEALIHLNNSLKDLLLILDQPVAYAKGIQVAYGPYRKIIEPPSGDTLRKFVTTQSQRLGRMNQGLRSKQEMAFFAVRQQALKTLGTIYTQLQCRALGLQSKPEKQPSQEPAGHER